MPKFIGQTSLTELLAQIKAYFIRKSDSVEASTLDIDTAPTSASSNLITSGGVYNNLDTDYIRDGSKLAYSTQKEINTAMANAIGSSSTAALEITGEGYIQGRDIESSAASSASSKLITSGAVYTGLNNKQDKLPTTVNDKYLHTNSSTGALEWADTPKELFWCTYETTTIEEIINARDNGKQPVCLRSMTLYRGVALNRNMCVFSANAQDLTYTLVVTKIDGQTTWTDQGSISFENSLNKVPSISSTSTDTQYPSAKCVYNTTEDIREVAAGKTKNYVCNLSANPSFNTQNETVVISTFTTIDSVVHQASELALGDNIYITDTNVPDRWCGVTGSSATMYKLETAKVPVTDVKKNNVSLVTNSVANIPNNLSDYADDATHRLVTDTEKSLWSGKANATETGYALSVSGTSVSLKNKAGTVLNTITTQDTDTKNTAGSTDTSSKLFLIGATSQAANPQTYSQDTAYVGTDGCLYSGGSKVLTSHQDISGKANTTEAGYSLSVSGTSVSLKNKAGTVLSIITTQDTNTTYSAGTGLSLSGTKFNHSNSVTAGTASEGGSARTLAASGTFNIPSVTYDAQGHVTAKGSTTLTMPASMPASDVYSWAKASTKPAYSFGELSSRGEALLGWGGISIAGNVSPVDAAIDPLIGGNKMAFANAASVTVEYSTNSGSTWTSYGASDNDRRALVSITGYTAFTLGKGSSSSYAANRLRITLNSNAAGGNCYTSLKKILLNVSTNYAAGCTVTVYTRTIGNYIAGSDTWSTVGTYNISGWSGWNSIPLSLAFGGSTTQTNQTAQIRLVFSQTGGTGNCTVGNIHLLGITNWTSPSTLASTGHLYSYDISQNASFPAGISTVGNVSVGGTLSATGNTTLSGTLAVTGAITQNGTAVSLSGHTHSDYQSKTTAVTHTASTAVGSATQPVYINSSGVATATTYALNKTVPSDAKFTDTTYSVANTTTLGLVKSTTTGTTSGRDYNVEVNSTTGTMKVNVPWVNTTYSVATTSTNGLMSSTDKTTLNNTGSTLTTHVSTVAIHRNITISTGSPSGGSNGDVWLRYNE